MGLLDVLMPYKPGTTGLGPNRPAVNPFTDWFDSNRNKIVGGFAGMAGAGNDPRAALTGFTQGIAGGIAPDTAYGQVKLKQAQEEQAARDAQAKQAAQVAFIQQNAGKYAPAVAAGVLSPADAYKAQLESGQPSGGFQGTGLDAQAWNTVIKAQSNPALKNTAEFQAAWAILNEPKITWQQTEAGMVPVMQQPSIPTGWGPNAAPAQSAMPHLAAPNSDVAPIGAFGGTGGAAAPSGVPGVSVGQPVPNTQKPPTEQQGKLRLLGGQLTQDLPTVMQNFDALANPKQQLLGAGGRLTNPLQSEEYQRANSALKASVTSIVYAVSGAQATESEVNQKVNEVMPRFGDKPGVLADKKLRLANYVKQVAIESNDPNLKAVAERLYAEIYNSINAPQQPAAPAAAPVAPTAPTGKVQTFPNGITVEPLD